MRKFRFSPRATCAIAAVAGVAAFAGPATSASADPLGSSTLFATAQGTSVLGHEVPVLGTQGWYVTLPVGSQVVPGETLVWEALDFTATSEVTVGGQEIVNLYVDPRMLC